jgi:methionyl aminopeptidase
MAITIKTAEEIEKMRVAGRLAAEVLDMITPHVQAGVTTNELDQLCHEHIVNVQNAIPSPLNYKGFPKSICTSINHQVCHGVPGQRALKNGDILNIDITVTKNGYHGDSSRMFMIGKPSIRAKRLIEIAYECLWIGIRQVKPGGYLSQVGKAIQHYATAQKCSVVREYCGHGIGKKFHEPPQVLHYYTSEIKDTLLRPGMTFTIEPMINAGKRHIKVLPDKWTVVTKDHKPSAQWEHTLLVTEDGVEILTLGENEEQLQG